MKKLFLTSLLFTISAFINIYSQDILPKFSLKNVGNNRIIIGWVNNYSDVRQISIQRSFDSLNLYKTILTVPDPDAIQNGYMDTKATHDHMFYRLYILLDKGVYLFSDAKRPVIDSARIIAETKSKNINIDNIHWGDSTATPKPNHSKPQTISFTPSLYILSLIHI